MDALSLDLSMGISGHSARGPIVAADGRGAGQFGRYWQTVSTQVAHVDALPANRSDFSYRIRLQAVGPLQFIDIHSEAVVLRRSAQCISRDPRNHYIVSLHRTGYGVIRHDHSEVAMGPDTLVLLDKALPYETTFREASARLLICIPRVLLERRLSDSDRFLKTVVPTDRGIGRVAATYAESLLQEADNLDPVGQTTAAAVCVDLLATALMSTSEGTAEARADVHVALRRGGGLVLLSRIRAYIRAKLAQPDLDPAQIAQAHGISKRYLHALFATTGASVGAFIREERLERAYIDLGNPRLRDLSITEIVLRNGFNDVPHFTRCFKTKYGVRPNTLRNARREEN